ncbi:sulfite exporter TauE/SafE family protein [Myxococcota bacterium]|nr:sulfite exporter TauE/SafE family protein [Myxococcota bacterium]
MSAAALAALFVSGLGLSAAGSLHCAGMCGAFALVARGRPSWHLGRAATYVTLGAAAGAVASAARPLAGSGLPYAAAAACTVLVVAHGLGIAGVRIPLPFAAAGIGAPGWGPARPLLSPLLRRLARGEGGAPLARPAARFALGAANALLPCGLVYAGLALAAASGDAPGGAAAMSGFALGTVPALVLTSAGSSLLARWGRDVRVRRAAAAAVVAFGLATVWTRVPTLAAAPPPGSASGTSAPHCPAHPP